MENRKKKCGIVTFHSSHNYGSVLQAYAMVRVMQKMGLDAELIDFRHPRTTDMYEWRLWSTYKNWKWNLRELVLRGLFSFGKKREQVFSDFIENVLGMQIITSKRRITVEHATARDEKLLDMDGYDCVAVVVNQTFNSDGMLFEYTQSRHQPDYFCFQDIATRKK